MMKKYYLSLAAVLLLAVTANAQTWQGIITHNDFQCYYLGPKEKPTVIAAKEAAVMGVEWVHVKVRSPINLGNTGSAWAKIDGTSTVLDYHNGWIYMVFINANYNYITVYPDMSMKEGGKTVTLALKNLNMSEMCVNDHKAFDLYW